MITYIPSNTLHITGCNVIELFDDGCDYYRHSLGTYIEHESALHRVIAVEWPWLPPCNDPDIIMIDVDDWQRLVIDAKPLSLAGKQ